MPPNFKELGERMTQLLENISSVKPAVCSIAPDTTPIIDEVNLESP